MAKDQPTDTPEELDSRKAAQLSRIVAWTEQDRPKPDQHAQPDESAEAS